MSSTPATRVSAPTSSTPGAPGTSGVVTEASGVVTGASEAPLATPETLTPRPPGGPATPSAKIALASTSCSNTGAFLCRRLT